MAWYGDMELFSQLWRLLQLGSVTAEITFHPPVTPEEFADRKALSSHCERVADEGFARLLAGREAR